MGAGSCSVVAVAKRDKPCLNKCKTKFKECKSCCKRKRTWQSSFENDKTTFKLDYLFEDDVHVKRTLKNTFEDEG